MSNRSRTILTVAGVALLYVVCAKLGLALSFRAAQVTAVWPPTGFALVAILLFGRRAAAGVLLGAFLANATASEPLWVAAGIAIGNTLEAWAGAMLLRRVRFDARLAHVRDVIVLLGALIVSPIVSATIGVASLGAGGVQPMSALPELWWIWWLGDALGGLLVAPALLVWSHGEPMPRRRGAIVEGLLMLAGLLGASAFVFLRPAGVAAIEYIVFPFLIWAALRFGAAGTASAAVVANAVAVWGTHLGRGPFAGAGPERGLVPLQLFMAVAATTGLLLGAAAAQSRREHQRKDDFLAMLSHELRNPLAPILHAIELLDGRDDDVARDVIRRQAQHMARLVDDLLDVARITRGEVQLGRRQVTVAEVVNAAAGTWKHLVEQRRQKLSIWLPEETLFIDADPHRFTQIIANLLHNASKFTPEGGRISITAREESGSLVLRVRDNGAGMRPEVLAHAFEPFVQGAAGGLGLGLTLVRRLVELHGGAVEATSDRRGTEITLRVPTVSAERAAEPVPSPSPVATRSRRVLVVEDNDDARVMLSELLTTRGHEVETAADGAGAIAAAQRFVPEVVLLDIGLPGADGYAVARELRGIPECAGALLVAVTGYGQPEDRARAREAGFDEHLLKPVEAERLLELLVGARTSGPQSPDL